MMGRDDISPWRPEPDLGVHQCIAKVGEESAELSKICFRILAQGIAGSDPTTKQSNVEALIHELSDNAACAEFVQRIIGVTANSARIMSKVNGYQHWFKLIGVDMGNGEEEAQPDPMPVPEPVGNFPVAYNTQEMYDEYHACLKAAITAGYPTAKPSEVIAVMAERLAALGLRALTWGV